MYTKSPVLSSALSVTLLLCGIYCGAFTIKEASIDDLQQAFHQNILTSRQLVEFYLGQIHQLNPLLRGVIEVNPDALHLADMADRQRKLAKAPASLGALHGIPILLKDNIATKDKMNTSAGSFALVGSVVPRDAGVVVRLRKAGAIILGKASLTEWAAFRSSVLPNGFCGRSGQGKNPYVLSASSCGSSSGSAISVAANMAAVSLGTDTDGSILCPSSLNSIVGIRPTLGLTSKAGVVPISPRQDTVGPMCRTVSDAVYVLDAIVGNDPNDAASRAAAKYIPRGGYKQFLKPDGLKGKRLGIVRNPFFNFNKNDYDVARAFEKHLQTLRQKGAILVDHVEIPQINMVLNGSDEFIAMFMEFGPTINAYLRQLVVSPVRSLVDLIAFNRKNSKLEKMEEYGQDIFEAAQSFIGDPETVKTHKSLVSNLEKLSRNGIEKALKKNRLDAWVSPFNGVEGPDSMFHRVVAIGGYPGITVPAGYNNEGVPFGICFGGLKGSEPKLIEVAYAFELATKLRRPPSFKV